MGHAGKKPFRGVKLPKIEQKEAKFWTEKEAATFLMSIKGKRYYVFFALALVTGLRIGELMGLQWADVDFAKGCINVNKTCEQANKGGIPQFGPTKTVGSKRTVYIDPDTINLLKEHRKAQLEARLKAREWHDFDLVFCNNKGGAKNYNKYREFMKNTCKKIGITEITPHGIRHTHATILLTHGVPMEIIADRLGHSRGNSAGAFSMTAFSMTARYTHVTDKSRKEAALVYAKAMKEALLDCCRKDIQDRQ